MLQLDAVRLENREYLCSLIAAQDAALNQELRQAARAVTDQVFGREVFLRGLVEVSNICRRNCLYCGLNCRNSELSRYRMTVAEIVQRAELVWSQGLPTMVIQTGENPGYSLDEYVNMVQSIKEKTDLVLTLSLGEMSRDAYRALREAGADRYLIRHETANHALYAELHPGYTLAQRLRCLDDLQDLGYEVGSGFMIGLPGQSTEDLLDDITLLVQRRVHMAGVGPFIANPHTVLKDAPDGDVEVVLNIISLIRLLSPGCNIPATTALDSLLPDGRERGLDAGANVIMPVLTPTGFKEKYQLYPNKRCLTHNPLGCIGCSKRRLTAQGYIASTAPGWSRIEQVPTPLPAG